MGVGKVSGLSCCENCSCFYVPRPPRSSIEKCETCTELDRIHKLNEGKDKEWDAMKDPNLISFMEWKP
jgi:hypothetical protein